MGLFAPEPLFFGMRMLLTKLVAAWMTLALWGIQPTPASL
jgi:hypothetical protein